MANNNKDKVLNAPPLRFPEFSRQWEKTKIGENCEVQMCKRILAQQTQPEGDVPFYKIGTIGGTPDAFIPYKLFAEYKEKYNYPRKGEILISCAGTVGRCVVFDGKDSYYQDSNIVWLRHDEKKYINDFLFYVMTQQDWRKLNTTTIVRIYNDDLRNLSFKCPSICEQRKISKFLSLIDERIATQIGLIDKLQSLIIGLAKYLTRYGRANTRICDCLECHASTLQESSVKEHGKYPVYGASGVVGYLDINSVSENAILIIKDGSGVGTTFYASGKYSVIGTLNYLTVKGNFSLSYLYYCLKVFRFEQYKTGMAIPHIYFKDYSRAKIWTPDFDEQNRIAKNLCAIESKLQIEQQMLTLLQTQKRYLLANLFI